MNSGSNKKTKECDELFVLCETKLRAIIDDFTCTMKRVLK